MSADTNTSPVKHDAESFYKRLKPNGKRLILSVDGGGAKGYMTLHCLAKLEELTGQPSYEIFDMMAGTSTGSLIAAGLAVGLNARQLIDIYKNRLPDVFEEERQPPWITRTVIDVGAFLMSLVSAIPSKDIHMLSKTTKLLVRNKGRYLYSHDRLREICAGFLSGPGQSPITLRELYDRSVEASGGQHTKRLLITIKDVRRSETLFVVNAGPGASAFQDMPLVDAVLASSVAPVFLEPFRVWIDGGVGSYGNPCYVATVEAAEYFTGLLSPGYQPRHDDLAYRHDNIIHFSFGTGTKPNYIRDEQRIHSMAFHEWLLYVISESQDDSNNEQVRLTEARFSWGNNWYDEEVHHRRVDFRRYQLVLDSDVLGRPVADGGLGLTLGAHDAELIRHLDMSASRPDELELMGRIGTAWAEAIGEDFACPHYPYVNQDQAYSPPASAPRSVPPSLPEYIAGMYPHRTEPGMVADGR
jgi:predicted acylesterase/phospholipase RssA